MMNTRDLFVIYFMKPVGLDGPIKIGISTNPRKRWKEYEAWSPFRLELIGEIPGRWIDEQFLHECLAEHHSHGEWFHGSRLVLNAVHEVLSTGGFESVRASLTPVMNVRAKKNSTSRATKAAHEESVT